MTQSSTHSAFEYVPRKPQPHYGCHNRAPYVKEFSVDKGYLVDPSLTPEQAAAKRTMIPFRMAPDCQYTLTGLGGTDLRCAGCKWASSGENVNKEHNSLDNEEAPRDEPYIVTLKNLIVGDMVTIHSPDEDADGLGYTVLAAGRADDTTKEFRLAKRPPEGTVLSVRVVSCTDLYPYLPQLRIDASIKVSSHSPTVGVP